VESLLLVLILELVVEMLQVGQTSFTVYRGCKCHVGSIVATLLSVLDANYLFRESWNPHVYSVKSAVLRHNVSPQWRDVVVVKEIDSYV
jgi:hypothetical protein